MLKICTFSRLFLAISAVAAVWGQTFSPVPPRILGHPRLQLATSGPNLVEGRELNAPQVTALDTSVSPPILYVANTGNNRVLAWRNATTVASGAQADLVIGQRDRFSTAQQGPGLGQNQLSTGLFLPTGLAVDRQGNLYVVDTRSNRILRYARPFQQTEELPTVDMVIGQRSLNGRRANQGELAASADSLNFSPTDASPIQAVNIAFDGQGNLWVPDIFNHRVLRFNASVLVAGRFGPPADIVVGQTDFTATTALAVSGTSRIRKDGLRTPISVAVDPVGRLYVGDGLSRVLVYGPGLPPSGASALRIAGVPTAVQGQPAPPPVNDTGIASPDGLFFVGNALCVVDGPLNRILRYDAFEQWPAESATQFSPQARNVYGQNDFLSARPNRGRGQAGPDAFASPSGGAVAGNELFLPDTANHRVLQIPLPGFGNATRVFGQVGMTQNAANLIEGREFFFPTGVGLVTDGNRLYVADTGNNRVLGFRDVRNVRPGDKADIVIGQPDFTQSARNYPTNDSTAPTDITLSAPVGLALDSNGNLYVADLGNSRVLRFPKPFDVAAGQPQRANLVLGQVAFTGRNQTATSRTMSAPFGLAFSVDGHLAVSDAEHARVLVFRKPQGGDFVSGQAANVVIGQPDFLTTTVSSADNRFGGPRLIAMDSSDRLYVTDAGNNRLAIYSRAPFLSDDPSPVQLMTSFTVAGSAATGTLRAPVGVHVNARTGEVWLADTGNGRLLRFPNFERLQLNQQVDGIIFMQSFASQNLGVPAPSGIVLDSFGNPIVADNFHRLSFFYPAHGVVNAANYLPTQRLAPGTIAALFATANGAYGEATRNFNELPNPIPMPTVLEDIEVRVNDRPAPIFFVSPTQINFLVPSATPASGEAEVQVLRKSTGQVLSTSPMRMAPVSPALFTANSSGSGLVAALNEDNTPHTAANPIGRGQTIQFFGTGAGLIPGGPTDGTPPEGAANTPEKPRVFVGTRDVPAENVTYSGLAPGLIGLWQINVKIPDFVAPGTQPVIVFLNDVASVLRPQVTTIAVKQ
ncbi:MAG: hypothetical protein FJW40_24830 [Acidobacteria bacterium]|nr:hypothetical protein [Acidobacteriota bacterium]